MSPRCPPGRPRPGDHVPLHRFVRSLLSVRTRQRVGPADPPPDTTGSLEIAALAHDLRNLLLVIDGAACMALDALGEAHPARADLLEIRRCATRATAATERLLVPAVSAASIPQAASGKLAEGHEWARSANPVGSSAHA